MRPDRDFRGFAGKIASGIVKKSDEIMALPSGKTSKVKSIVTYDGELEQAFPPQSVTITLEDEIDISRGEMLVHPYNLPNKERHFEAMLVWMDEKAMDSSTQFFIKHTSHLTKAKIDKIQYKVDINTLDKKSGGGFQLNEIGKVLITTVKPLYFDAYRLNRSTGAFVLIDPITNNTVAVGMIVGKLRSKEAAFQISSEEKDKIKKGLGLILPSEYEQRYNQKATTFWITGLHGSGKNELAFGLEKRLFDLGATVVLLDGSSVRSGLSKELDTTPSDNAEHLRRVAEVAKLLNDQGIIVICSFISPSEIVREQVKTIIGEERFQLIYMDADLAYCEKNKPELYEEHDSGNLENLPGRDVNFDVPTNADFVLKPNENNKNVEVLLERLGELGVYPLR
ncbi:MAG: hypothetical protein CSA36_09065 [Draconibacterium sp.]|nr:MAG: hypothetical protein CSA36_09065 [Draconibacterium sp.]